MTLWTPPVALSKCETNTTGQPVANAFGTLVTASATPHTKGAYSELIAAVAFDVTWVEVFMSEVNTNTVDTGTLVDIAIGGAGSEVVIIPNLNAGHAGPNFTSSFGGQKYAFPLHIPAGSRIAARSQAVVGSDDVRVAIVLRGGPDQPMWVGSKVVAYGVDAANSQGVAITAGTGSEGAWTEITSGTSDGHHFFSAGPAGASATYGGGLTDLDIGVGAAAAEQLLPGTMRIGGTNQEILTQLAPLCVWAHVPSGTRLAARGQGQVAVVADMIIYGVS